MTRMKRVVFLTTSIMALLVVAVLGVGVWAVRSGWLV
jgi:hypothetical protein